MTSQNIALWDINIALTFIVGYISIYSNKDFSPLKNDLVDFQLAQPWSLLIFLLSNKLEFFYAVFGKTICFSKSISILQSHWNS